MEYISREEADELIHAALDDWLSDSTLTDILDLIYPDEYVVVEQEDYDEEE